MKKWRPNKAQRKAFAIRMQQDTEFAKEYYERKEERERKRRANSKFDYEKAGGFYVPTQFQHDKAIEFLGSDLTIEQQEACEIVIAGYCANAKVHHDYIHIVNELIRKPDTV